MLRHEEDVKVFALNSNPELAQEIVEVLGIKAGNCSVKRFSDGEIHMNVEESIRGCDTYLVQSIAGSGNDYLMELLIMIDALKRASAKTINVVLPYYGYARQDRKTGPRQPITAKLIANMLERSGATRVLTVDLHANQIEGFFNIPVDQVSGIPILAEYFEKKNLEDIIVVAPDNSSALRARKLGSLLDVPIALIDRRSYDTGEPSTVNVIGDVKGKTAIIIDDMIDTSRNVTFTSRILEEHGVKEVYATFTHAVLSGNATEEIAESNIKEVVVTNTIALPESDDLDKITVLSIAPLLAKAIQVVQEKLSISKIR
ncbi:ribose-phosphate diphosphokinase [Pseudalkalibacillus hwajinpoensis]|uniref:Putative ribose-phosphate pyrophosphokinase n=1 Tax=Guptibacillus hwajinpoensis TaxID=208199 RepID=A0A4U1MNX9_9BACL|nr:ribose-phosphate pyrophosphokinase [Pseudalkalibacillus hwajinpoensis]TKD72362.1 ribose-phosphate pyrophosphokinase [Pseudalkalibacillus hwajinpoensis]